MKSLLKQLLGRTPLYSALRNWAVARRQQRELVEWEERGRPVPPPHLVKQRTIREYAQRFGTTVFVETGTYFGDMVEAMKRHFSRTYSIELAAPLSEQARRRFAGDPRIEIIHGDSAIELGRLLARLEQPALFWLDGHYSEGVTARGAKDTPILEELTHILGSPQTGHVVIVDDARRFGADPAYPSLEELKVFIRSKRPDADIEVANDMIRVVSRRTAG